MAAGAKIVFLATLALFIFLSLAPPPPVQAFQATPINATQYVIAGFRVDRVFTSLAGVRGLTPDPLSDALLAVGVGGRQVVCLWANATIKNNASKAQPALDFSSTGESFPNHGIAVDAQRGFIYLSSPDKVYRWSWPGCSIGMTYITAAPVTVVQGIPINGHYTRTLETNGSHLYISVGSWANMITGENRAAIFRYPLEQLAAATTDTAFNFPQGSETVAIGLRNAVGFRFGEGGMWIVENGIDDAERADLGGDIHLNNPGEEINRLAISEPLPTNPPNFGFPLCFSEFALESLPNSTRGTQWSISGPSTTASAANDAICRDPSQNIPPLFLLPPHVAPLDLAIVANDTNKFTKGDLVISAHGSWNRQPPQGYGLYYVRNLARPPFSLPSNAKYELIFGDSDTNKCLNQAQRTSCLRPVGVVVDKQGAVWFSMDSVGQVVRLVPDPLVIGVEAVQVGEGGIGGVTPITTTRPSSAARVGARWAMGVVGTLAVLLLI